MDFTEFHIFHNFLPDFFRGLKWMSKNGEVWVGMLAWFLLAGSIKKENIITCGINSISMSNQQKTQYPETSTSASARATFFNTVLSQGNNIPNPPSTGSLRAFGRVFDDNTPYSPSTGGLRAFDDNTTYSPSTGGLHAFDNAANSPSAGGLRAFDNAANSVCGQPSCV